MKSHVLLTIEATRKRFLGRLGRHLLLLPLLAMVASPHALRAQSGQSATPDPQTLQALIQRIDQLEARVRQLEAAQRQPAPAATLSAPQQPASSPSQVPPPPTLPATSLSEPAQANPPQEHEAEPAEHAEDRAHGREQDPVARPRIRRRYLPRRQLSPSRPTAARQDGFYARTAQSVCDLRHLRQVQVPE